MKKLILTLMLFSYTAWAQIEANVQPVISTTTIASCVTTSATTSISATAKPFGSVVVGQAVYGPGIPINTVVASLQDPALDSVIILSKAATASATVSLQFGYYTSAAYSSGDWLGLPFVVYPFQSSEGGTIEIVDVTILDNADVAGATDIAFFSDMSGSAGLDNVAIAVPAVDESYQIGYMALATSTDLGAMREIYSVVSGKSIFLPRSGTLYGRLVAKSTPTFTAVNNLRVRVRFR